MRVVWKRRVGLALFLLLLAGFLYGASVALTPVENTPGMKWQAYKREPANSIDALFVGSSYAFCDIIPARIYAECGYSAYVVGAPSMPPRLMEYYLREALRTQSPSVVFIELTGVNYPAYTAYPEMNIGFMPASWNRLMATFTCGEPEKRAGLLFPLYLYHDTWNTVTAQEVKSRLFPGEPDINAGYCYRDGAGDIPTDSADAVLTFEEAIYRENLAAIARMARLAGRKGAGTVCYLKADLMRLDVESVERLKADIAALGEDITFFYGNDSSDQMGLDEQTDFFDPSHMNYSGAEKFSVFLAKMLSEQGLVTHPAEKDEGLWLRRVAQLNQWSGEPLS